MGKIAERIGAKVTRAKQHIQDFQLAARAFNDTGPYAVSKKEDVQTGKRVYYILKADPVPDHVTAIAADVIQNLRSALDHIAYQLVLDARGGTRPDWTVYYPISSSAAYYPATRGGKIKGVRQEVIDAIDATEPYKGGKGHALWQLNELNKPDKHELLVGAGSFFDSVDISGIFTTMFRKHPKFANITAPPLLLRSADKLLTLKIGDELYSEPIETEVNEHIRFTFDISFQAPGIVDSEPAIKTMHDLANLVGDITERLGRFIPA